MKSVFLLLTSLLILPVGAQVDISGYYENTLQVEYGDETDELLLDTSKLRLDFEAGGGEEELLFTGNINGITRHTAASLDVSAYLPEAVAAELESVGIGTIWPFPKDRIYVANAYLEWNTGGIRLRAGKQQLSWGPGYGFNPTDLFHRKDILDPTYEKEGVTAFRADYFRGIGGQISVIEVPGDTWESGGYAVRLCTHISTIGYDIALTLHQVQDTLTVDPVNFLMVEQKRRAVGLETSGTLLGLGIWFEGNYNYMESEDDFIRFISGIDYTFASGMNVKLEGLYNDRGENRTPYQSRQWLSYIMNGEPLAEFQGMVAVSKDMTELMTGSIYGFGCSDGSYLINPRIDYSIAQNADLTLYGGFTSGDDQGQFVPGLASFVGRITVYF